MKKKIIFLAFSLFLMAEEGEKLYSKYGCYGCHGIDAKGGNGFPYLANRPKSYLINRLKGYKYGKIKSNRAGIMYPYAKQLSDKEIERIANYLSDIKEKTESYEEEWDLSNPGS